MSTPKPENLAALIYFVRSEKVLLDADLAQLYGVQARALNPHPLSWQELITICDEFAEVPRPHL